MKNYLLHCDIFWPFFLKHCEFLGKIFYSGRKFIRWHRRFHDLPFLKFFWSQRNRGALLIGTKIYDFLINTPQPYRSQGKKSISLLLLQTFFILFFCLKCWSLHQVTNWYCSSPFEDFLILQSNAVMTSLWSVNCWIGLLRSKRLFLKIKYQRKKNIRDSIGRWRFFFFVLYWTSTICKRSQIFEEP